MKPACFSVGMSLLLGLAASAQPLAEFTFTNLNLTIPDGDSIGVVNVQSILTEFTEIASVRVSLEIEGAGFGGFNGDLYVSLSHDSGFAVLLGRTGRSSDNLFGYSDSGFNITFDDDAANGDVHNYRLTLNGNHNLPITGPLTGVWSPDGRVPENPDEPEDIRDTTPRSAFLQDFAGLDPNGLWTLHLVDHSSGATNQLASWGLVVTGIPEPRAGVLLGVALAFLLGGGWRVRLLADRRK